MSVLLKFIATGVDYQDANKENKLSDMNRRFEPRYGDKGISNLITKRNYMDQFSQEYKKAAKNKYTEQTYRDNFMFNNTTYKEKNFGNYYSSQHKADLIKQKNEKPSEIIEPRLTYLERCDHIENWKINKERQYAMQKKDVRNAKEAKSLTKMEFQSARQNTQSEGDLKAATINYQGRENFYATKPRLKIDKDLKDPYVIDHVQYVSEDLPEWTQYDWSNKVPGHKERKRRTRTQGKPNTDLFGNKLVQYENNFKFGCEPAHAGLREENNKIMICDRDQCRLKAKQNLSREHLVRGKQGRLSWANDNSQKQKFDTHILSLPRNIGYTKEPYIKALEQKRHPVPLKKIGEGAQIDNLEKVKKIQLKIGHGEPEVLLH